MPAHTRPSCPEAPGLRVSSVALFVSRAPPVLPGGIKVVQHGFHFIWTPRCPEAQNRGPPVAPGGVRGTTKGNYNENTKGNYKGKIQMQNTNGNYKGKIQMQNTKGNYKGKIQRETTMKIHMENTMKIQRRNTKGIFKKLKAPAF